jgi:myo-inositol-1(or 4)-monophosphatase
MSSDLLADSNVVNKAIVFATKAHAGQTRKGGFLPYIVHPCEAMAIVASVTPDPELLAAAVLHDVVEDTDTTIEDIHREFGPRVAELVDAETEPKVPGLSEEESWKLRRQGTLDRLAAASRDAKIVALGDKLSNMRAIARDYMVVGDELWQRFTVHDPALHEWHYRGLVESLSEISDCVPYDEFRFLVDRVWPRED